MRLFAVLPAFGLQLFDIAKRVILEQYRHKKRFLYVQLTGFKKFNGRTNEGIGGRQFAYLSPIGTPAKFAIFQFIIHAPIVPQEEAAA